VTTSAERALQEEVASLLHTYRVVAMRTVMQRMQPLLTPRVTGKKTTEWEAFDELLLLSSKKWECLTSNEAFLVKEQAGEVLTLLHDLWG